MENPYSPPNEIGKRVAVLPTKGSFAIVFALYALVMVNYATATSRTFSLNSLMHVAFLLAPIAIVAHLSNLAGLERGETRNRFVAMYAPALVILLAFLASWVPYFSNNPYEGFALTNLYFGPYGWMHWFWLTMLGILPSMSVLRLVRRSNPALAMISCLAIAAHIHNAYWVWILSHLKD